MAGPNLVLVGFMAVGKSTIGRRCGKAMGMGFVDTDRVVEEWAGKAISAIFEQDGEQAFRALERRAVAWAGQRRGAVIATGGGALQDPANVGVLRADGVLVWLRADPATLVHRAGDLSRRPLLACAADPAARVEELLLERSALYAGIADTSVDSSGLSREEATARVVEAYRSVVGSGDWSRDDAIG